MTARYLGKPGSKKWRGHERRASRAQADAINRLFASVGFNFRVVVVTQSPALTTIRYKR